MSSPPTPPTPSDPPTPHHIRVATPLTTPDRSPPKHALTTPDTTPPKLTLPRTAFPSAALLDTKSYIADLEARIAQAHSEMAYLEGDILEARARVGYLAREIAYWEHAAKWPEDLYGKPPKSVGELIGEGRRAVGVVRRLAIDHKDLWEEKEHLKETLKTEKNALEMREPPTFGHVKETVKRRGTWAWLGSVAGMRK